MFVKAPATDGAALLPVATMIEWRAFIASDR
jgi:hypothetical protein